MSLHACPPLARGTPSLLARQLLVRRVTVVDVFRPSNGRGIDDLAYVPGGTVRDYLQPEALACPEAVLVTLDSRRIEPRAWSSTPVRPGAHVGVAVWPAEPATIVAVVGLIISAAVASWSAVDAHHRAVIQGHHMARRQAAAAQQMADSAIYGWDGIQNTTQPGRPIPILYGRHRVGGQVIYAEAYKDNNGKSKLDVTLCLSEGEIEEVETSTIRINDRPLSEYPNVSVEAKLGTNAQTAATNHSPGLVIQTRNQPGNAITAGGAAVTYVTGNPRTAYQLDFSFPDGLRGTVSGPLGLPAFAEATFNIRHRVFGSSTWSATSTIKTGKRATTAPFTVTYKGPQLAAGRYEIEVTRSANATVNGPLGSASAVDANHSRSTFAEAREYNNVGLRYPNLALLHISALASDQLNGMLPTITVIAKGRKCNVYTKAPGDVLVGLLSNGEIVTSTTFRATDGHAGFTTLGVVAGDRLVVTDGGHAGATVVGSYTIASVTDQTNLVISGTFPALGTSVDFQIESANGVKAATFTRNPAWCVLDLLTSTRYGAGQHLQVGTWDGQEDLGDIDIQAFIDAAAFADVLVARVLAASNPIQSGSGNATSTVGTNQVNMPGGTWASGTVRVDDTLVISTGGDAGTYRIDSINVATGRLTVSTVTGGTVTFAGVSGADWHVNGTERRAQCDYVLDGQSNVWDAALAMAHAAQMELIRGFGPYRLVPDQEGEVVAVFGYGNIIDDSYRHEYLAHRRLANRVEAQYLNADLDYQQDLAEIEDPSVLANNESPVKSTLEMYSITRETQAHRQAKRHYLENRYAREMIEFECAADGLPLQWGDKFIFVHEITQVDDFFSGRAAAGTTGTTLALDKAITVPTGTIEVYVWTRTEEGGVGIDNVLRGTIEQAAGTRVDEVTVAGTQWVDLDTDVVNLDGPRPGDVWVLCPRTVVVEQDKYWKVTNISLTAQMRRKIRAVAYRTEVYDETPVPATLVAA